MQSFRTETEIILPGGKTVIEKDILELEEKIRRFRNGTIDPEKFRSLRLARGVYGQRQQGVQMVRIKIPYGKISPAQLRRIADLTEEFSTANIHFTTRQDVQLHFVSLDRTPELWAKLEESDLTMREACGNTVRNVTASPEAGIDPEEPFDITPYADALFRYFLRHPVGQDMGRKIKIAFSSSEKDSAFTFMHDVGFIPRVEIREGKIVRGFKVLIGGGLGAQPFTARTAFEFLPAEEIIPFTETLLRVFDRYGERNNRHKARLKYLVNQLGADEVLRFASLERISLAKQKIPIDGSAVFSPAKKEKTFTTFRVSESEEFKTWKDANTFPQKQDGWYGVYVKITLGNISSVRARVLASLIEEFSEDDARVTPGQSILLRFVPANALPALFTALKENDFHATGAESLADITACPGTDTCNLGISNSTGVALELEKVVREEFPELVAEKNISIRISGCMNSCGQHSLAQIGFHGSSVKAGTAVAPALQLLLGGGPTGSGNGRIAEKIGKFPGRRAPAVLRTLLADFRTNANRDETFNDYFDRAGKNYFYNLVKPFFDVKTLAESELIDWGQEERFVPAIGVGECAGVKIDLVSVLIAEAEDSLAAAEENLPETRYADAIYKTYNAFIHSAKALLLSKEVHVNTQHGVLNDFDRHFVETGEFSFGKSFRETVLELNREKPSEEFARKYLGTANDFFRQIGQYRKTGQHGLLLN
ncbi:MAG TPA: HEPN domain-containing protein [Bacteroidia bacterium]|nr:HEPN domain-containing protein [Bacteroidia bacterium]